MADQRKAQPLPVITEAQLKADTDAIVEEVNRTGLAKVVTHKGRLVALIAPLSDRDVLPATLEAIRRGDFPTSPKPGQTPSGI